MKRSFWRTGFPIRGRRGITSLRTWSTRASGQAEGNLPSGRPPRLTRSLRRVVAMALPGYERDRREPETNVYLSHLAHRTMAMLKRLAPDGVHFVGHGAHR